jgi:hypothetical protein
LFPGAIAQVMAIVHPLQLRAEPPVTPLNAHPSVPLTPFSVEVPLDAADEQEYSPASMESPSIEPPMEREAKVGVRRDD